MKEDIETNTCSIAVPDNISLSLTDRLPAEVKFCAGAKVMLLDNRNVSDRMINGSIGAVKPLDIRSNVLCIKYMWNLMIQKLEPPWDRRLRNELKKCVPITARTNKFPLKKGKGTVIPARKHFPLILGHAITVHKFQGSTLNYMNDDLSWSTGKKTATGKTYQQPISQCQFYTLISCAKSCDNALFWHFDPEQIKVNESALEELIQEPVFSWQHPLKFQWY